jgi:hypothetical protein
LAALTIEKLLLGIRLLCHTSIIVRGLRAAAVVVKVVRILLLLGSEEIVHVIVKFFVSPFDIVFIRRRMITVQKVLRGRGAWLFLLLFLVDKCLNYLSFSLASIRLIQRGLGMWALIYLLNRLFSRLW